MSLAWSLTCVCIKLVEKQAQKTPFGSHICPAIRGDNPNGQKKTSRYTPNSVVAHSILITLVLYRLIPSFFGAIPKISERISGSNPFFRRWLVESSLDMETSPLNHIVKSRCLLVKSCKIQALLIKSYQIPIFVESPFLLQKHHPSIPKIKRQAP